MSSTSAQQSNIKVWIFHDMETIAAEYAEFLYYQGGITGIPFERPSQCLSAVEGRLSECDVVLIHKDLGQYCPAEQPLRITSDRLIRTIHQEAPHIHHPRSEMGYINTLKPTPRIWIDSRSPKISEKTSSAEPLLGPYTTPEVVFRLNKTGWESIKNRE